MSRRTPEALLLAAAMTLAGCAVAEPESPPPQTLTQAGFRDLLTGLAEAWERQDTPAAVALFTPEAVYMQPPDVQLFVGRDELESYFGALKPGTKMVWHHSWFDTETQVGAGEFSFGLKGRDAATHGVAIIEVRDGLVDRWHEYLQPGPASRVQFLAVEGKTWEWHIGNYP